MNAPTKLTWMRIILSFVIMFILLFPFDLVNVSFPRYLVGGVYIKSQYVIAGVLFIFASLTDFLDGYLARRNHMVTDLGKMLDSIADKVLVDSVLIILAGQGFISLLVPVVIIVRDIIVNAIKMQASTKGKVVSAIMSGKIKTACLMVGITLVFFYNLPFELWNLRVSDFLLYFASVMAILSGVEYYRFNKELLKNSLEEK